MEPRPELEADKVKLEPRPELEADCHNRDSFILSRTEIKGMACMAVSVNSHAMVGRTRSTYTRTKCAE